MAKSKKFTPNKAFKGSKRVSHHESVLGSDDGSDGNVDQIANSDNDSNEFDDEMDSFHRNKDKELLKRSAFHQNNDLDLEDDESDDNEEVMPFDDSDEEQSDDRTNDGLNRFEVEFQKSGMASDLEDSDDGLPDVNAWGKKKNVFYNTDYVDKDFRKYNIKDEHLAQYEEEEALAIQRRLLESINESDIGIQLLIGDIEPKAVPENQLSNEETYEDEERLQTNVLNLSKRQKIELLKKESPELQAIINDYNICMTEMKDRLQPVMQLIKEKKVRECIATKYIETRFQILINYCINICFYMVLKTKRIPVKDHPVIQQLLSYKKLLLELNSVASSNGSINSDIDLILDKLSKGEDIKFIRKRFYEKKRKNADNLKTGLKKVKFADDLQTDNHLQSIEEREVDNEDNETLSKRGITYEIAKNKGLTPKRKKELKNPRVKHRMKYRKAKIRRKGQVREPRKELQRYGGEISGIKSGVVKSIKFK